MKKVVIGLDISTVATGWCHVVDGQIVDSGTFKVSKNYDLETRLAIMLADITDLIDELSLTDDNTVIIEDTWMANNVKTMQDLTRLIGMVEGYLLTYEIDYKTVKPSQWRKKLGLNKKGAKRVELKKLAYEYVTNTGYVVESEDEADACGIALAYIL